MVNDRATGIQLSAEARQLLNEIIEAAATRYHIYQFSERRDLHQKPWIRDELQSHGLIAPTPTELVPTLKGLRVSQLPAAEHLWDNLKDLIARMYAATANHPHPERYPVGYSSRVAAKILVESEPSLFSYFNPEGPMAEVAASPDILTFQLGPFAPAEPDTTSPLRVQLRDYRGLQVANWCPHGVSLLVGPNGSGKSSLLRAYDFFRTAYSWGLKLAQANLGANSLKRIGAPPEALVQLELRDDQWAWRFEFQANAGGISTYPAETLLYQDQVVVHGRLGSPDWYVNGQKRNRSREDIPCLRMAADAELFPEVQTFIKKLSQIRFQPPFELSKLRQGNLGTEQDDVLDPHGGNLTKVLRNWQSAPRKYQDRFEWVRDRARDAFPDLIDQLELDAPVGNIVSARFFKPGSTVGLPIDAAADGLLVGLLQLTAVAGATEGGWVAIDEMENQLHPFAIESLLASFRARAESHRLNIVLTTHSPVLMNAFRENPGQIYVTTPKDGQFPVALDQLRDPEWLAHFYPGELYERGEFGAPGDKS